MSDENGNNEGNEATWINTDGSFGDLSKAPEGVGEFITRQGWKDLPAMANSHRELEKKLSGMGDMVKMPDADDIEGQRAFATKLGCPEKPEDYKYEAKDGDPMDANLLNLFKESAYKDGMPQKAFQDVVDFQIAAIVESNKQYEDKLITDKEEAIKAIKERFNSEDEYNEYTKKALGFASEFKLSDGETTAADVLERKGLAYDPEILEMFGSLADSVSEDSLPRGKTRTSLSKDEQLKAIKENPAFMNRMHPDHEKVMQTYNSVFGFTVRDNR
jgi:hypothetical protein